MGMEFTNRYVQGILVEGRDGFVGSPRTKEKKDWSCLVPVLPMVLLLDGNSEIGSYVRSNLVYLIFLMHLIRSSIVPTF